MFLRTIRAASMALGLAATLLAVLAVPAFATTSVTTEAPTNVTATSATLNATITTDGLKADYGFEYGLNEKEEGIITKAKTISAGEKAPVKVSEPVTGLQPNTTYYVHAGALFYGGGPSIGKYVSFKTPKALGFYISEDGKFFEAVEYPAQIETVSEVAPMSFTFAATGGGQETFNCEASSFGTELTAPSGSVSLDASMSGCSSKTWAEVTVKMNSCYFDVPLIEPVGIKIGAIGIGCDTGGDAIELAMVGCKLKLPAQSPTPTLVIPFGEPGPGATVRVGLSRSLEYTKSGAFCKVFSGAASMSGTTLLGAVG